MKTSENKNVFKYRYSELLTFKNRDSINLNIQSIIHNKGPAAVS